MNTQAVIKSSSSMTSSSPHTTSSYTTSLWTPSEISFWFIVSYMCKTLIDCCYKLAIFPLKQRKWEILFSLQEQRDDDKRRFLVDHPYLYDELD